MTFEQHLLGRGLRPWMGYGKWVCNESEIITFPLWNLSGQLIGYQAYNWRGDKNLRKGYNPREQKYFTRLPKGSDGVFGLDLIPEGYQGPIYLVEGVWEALAGHNHGLKCLAVLGCNPKSMKKWLDTIPNDVIVLAQPDSAGQKLKKFAKSRSIQLSGDLDDVLHIEGLKGIPELGK